MKIQPMKSVKRGAEQAGSAAWTWVTQWPRSRRALFRTADSAPFSAVSAAPSSSWDGATCRDALVGLQLRLLVGDDGTITNATAYLDVRTLVTAAEQTFAAKFEYASELGRTDLRPVSGRPGYQRGLPLLVADGTTVPPGENSNRYCETQ